MTEFGRTAARTPVLIMSYEAAARASAELGSLSFDLLICDEAHRLKNAESKTYRALLHLGVPRRLLITGTPVQNDLMEFFALADFVCPGLLGAPGAFRRIFERPIVASRQEKATEEEKEIGETRNAELAAQLKRHFLRRTAEVNEAYLRPKNELVLFCRPSQLQSQLYRAVGKSILSQLASAGLVEGAGGLSTRHLAAIDTLRKLCNHPIVLQQSLEDRQEAAELDADSEGLLRLFPDGYETEDIRLEDSGKLHVLINLLHWIRTNHPTEKVS